MAVDWRPSESEIVSQAFDVAQSYKANELGTVAKFRDVGDTDLGSAFFKYVQYEIASGAAGVAGEVAYYYKLDGFKTHQVTCDASEAIMSGVIVLGAGVLHSTPADSEYCWIQLTGPATLTIAIDGSAADGDALTATGASDGTLDVVDYTSVTTAFDGPVVAYAGDDSDNEIICKFPM